MKKFFSILLSIIFALVLLVTFLFNIVRVNVTPSKIMDLGASMVNALAMIQNNDTGLFYTDQKIITPAGYQIEGMDIEIDLNNLDLGELIQEIAKENGYDFTIDEELIADILSDPETKDLVDNVMNQAVEYMAGKTDTIDLNPDKIESVVTKSIKKIEEKTGEKIEYDAAELKANIASGVEEALPSVTETLDIVKEENSAELDSVLKILDFLSVKYLVIMIAMLVVLAAIIFVINMNIFALFRYISIPSIVVGIIFIILGLMSGVVNSVVADVLKADFESLIKPVSVLVSAIFHQFLIYGIFAFVPGVALCVVGFINNKKKIVQTKETSKESQE